MGFPKMNEVIANETLATDCDVSNTHCTAHDSPFISGGLMCVKAHTAAGFKRAKKQPLTVVEHDPVQEQLG